MHNLYIKPSLIYQVFINWRKILERYYYLDLLDNIYFKVNLYNNENISYNEFIILNKESKIYINTMITQHKIQK